ncbi:galactosylgalactosylxylosylprotein 3-beta-glucuronosyltransferase I [Culex quinquefasciatus]|uniref:Galactosylgalactosylxylosylprotein 3-beta-glucuronosyltransferase n=1 Tax=Culex quinquefasciatus TaxID=7176 RepID=B0WB76_CULQU|nr:galactosylgalactosylxylosylprotein 3-beta-glucuronosyltransferase I [Culex quinquefasciatus]XP_039441200.1 galactosylgalactosylxylosylprotein 3-beta-glucuronosyltransferase I [Culex pipiens pallens]EDS42141.1 galactosylgalactosylxylosylprotein 3-beta-glucuronosyltransferase I [Culex quinquefasciatus]|eukprot:XP_001845960.1 galactosylgalactosylxylosylprotein 3-beta-glucuronosyltransferase I [Culex quinquefasciatus]
MNQEIRIKTKHFYAVLVILGFLLIYSLSSNNGCDSDGQSSPNSEFAAAGGREAFLLNQKGPTIYAITPTYARPVQKAELTRLSQVIRLSPNVFWVLVEDADHGSELVANLLRRSGLEERSVQLFAKTPTNFKLQGKDPNWLKPRGVEQRNKALDWVRRELAANGGRERHSVVYFMDDDNTYSSELFGEMSKIERNKVGVWPVGLVGGLMVEKPVLNRDGIVLGFNSAWRPERPFPLDMAGFAISSDLLLDNPQAQFSYEVERGYQESEILRHLTIVHEMQPLANKCTDVLVWHTRTENPKLDAEKPLVKAGKRSDAGLEV